jgi:hypothetical protein
MVKIVSNPRAWWPVVFPGVTEEGEVVENRCEFRFLLLDEDAAVALSKEANALAASADDRHEAASEEERKHFLSSLYAELVMRVATDWRGVEAENGEPLKFETENVRKLMAMPGDVFIATVRAWSACRAGRKDTRAGN